MNKPLLALRVAAACALAGLCHTSQALDLIDSYQRALQADPGVRAAEAARAAGREKALQGDALLRPQVSLSANLTRLSEHASTQLPAPLTELIKPDSSGSVHQAAVQLVQPLYNAKARAEKQQQHERSALSEIDYRREQQDLMQRVAEAYFALLLAQDTLQVTLAEKTAVQMQWDRAKARFEVGRGKVTDVQEAQARHDSVLAREVSARGNLALRQAQYSELTGAPADGLASLRDDLQPTPPQPDSLAAWQLKGRDANARVLVKQRDLAIAGAEIGKYALSGRPTLDLVAGVTYKGQSGGLPATIAPDSGRSVAVGVQFNLPLYAGGAIDSRQREALARRSQAEQEVAVAQRDMRLQVQDAFLAVKTGVARVAALTQSLLSARTALEATTLGRDVGSRTELDVLDAQQRVFTTQLDLAQARVDYLLGRVRLSATAGDLYEGDLQAINSHLAK